MKDNIYVIKLWSNVLLDDWGINELVVSNVVKSVNFLVENWIKVLIVSSWSVALWKKNIWLTKINWLSNIEWEQIFSSLWQVSLINFYQNYFNKFNINVSQALLTRKDFSDRKRYNSMKNVLLKSLELGVIPIINENDVLSQEELDFSDNDELSALLAAMIWADKLIILSTIDGLYDKFPWWKLLKEVNEINDETYSMVWEVKSSLWKWWMASKLNTAWLLLDLWIDLYLWNWKKEDTIKNIFLWNNPGTLFKSISWKKVDSIRKWLKAWAVPKWKIFVSNIISDLLKQWKRASLLSIWIEKIEKEFSKKDVVEVCDINWESIWYWTSKMNSAEIDKNINKIVIHTDYFIRN